MTPTREQVVRAIQEVGQAASRYDAKRADYFEAKPGLEASAAHGPFAAALEQLKEALLSHGYTLEWAAQQWLFLTSDGPKSRIQDIAEQMRRAADEVERFAAREERFARGVHSTPETSEATP